MDFVVVGGGIHGASVAYFLSLQEGCNRARSITLIERSKIASAASGKAGGFLARNWGDGPIVQLHKKSFDLHSELANTLNIRSYRKGLKVVSVDGNLERSASNTKNCSWLDRKCSVSPLDNSGAQVTPEELTQRLVEASGCTVVIDIALGVEMDESSNFRGVRTAANGVISGDRLIIAAGPWTGVLVEEWFPHLICPMEGIKSTSMLYEAISAVKTEPVVCFSEEHDQHSTHLELYPRPNGDLYVFAGRKPALTQACMRPCPPDGLPIMGPIPTNVGPDTVYVSAGHNCWGILWAPICGKAMAQLAACGSQDVLDLRAFDISRFNVKKRG
eukprot:GSChrysophyteH2.ASY1.ANO1.1453.1 assembled CDS